MQISEAALICLAAFAACALVTWASSAFRPLRNERPWDDEPTLDPDSTPTEDHP